MFYSLNRFLFLGLIAASTLAACNSLKGKEEKVKLENLSADTLEIGGLDPELFGVKPLFLPPTVPANILSPEKRAEFITEHYWQDKSLADTSLVGSRALSYRRTIMDFLGFATSLPADKAKEWLLKPLKKSNGSILLYTLSCYYEYLYKVSSPLQSKAHYRHVLEWAQSSPKLLRQYQEEAERLLSIVERNLIGNKAEDFSYKTIDGITHRLSRSFAPLRLLIFYSPDCERCHRELEELGQNETLMASVERRELEILYINPNIGGQQHLRVDSIGSATSSIVYGLSIEDLLALGLYDIQAWPTIYLLGSSGEVLLGDVTMADVVSYIESYIKDRK